MTIGVVGPCGAGKSTLVNGLQEHGIRGKNIAQEHSYVPYMWKRLTNPDILVYLGVSYEKSCARRALNWTEEEYAEQLKRLEHAYNHADLVIDTNNLTAQEILDNVIQFLSDNGINN